MPRYPSLRTKANRDIAAIVSKLNAAQAARLSEAMGSPPSFANVPESVWERFENELRSQIAATVLLLYTSTLSSLESRVTDQFGEQLKNDPKRPDFDGSLSVDRKAELAQEYAAKRAEEAAREYAEATRKKLEAAEAKVNTQPDGSPFPPLSREDGDLADKLAEEARKVLNDKRADGMGINETNKAIVNAESDYGKEIADYSNYKLLAVWSHNPNPPPNHAGASVEPCKICTPLLGLAQNEWPVEYMTGPPAHPHCDCHLEYNLLSPDDAAEIRLK